MIRLPRIPRGLLLACSLSLLLLVFGYLSLAGDAGAGTFDHAAFRAVFERPILGTSLAWHIGWFLAALITLHLLFGAACWLMARATRFAFPQITQDIRNVTALWFIGATVWLLVWNSGEYPRTSLGKLYANGVGIRILWLGIHTWLTLAFVAVIGFILLRALRRVLPTTSERTRLAWASSAAAVGILMTAWQLWPRSVAEAPPDKPNVILLGIDSLRWDEVQRGPGSNTPNVDQFLTQALRFDNATTPLARTYPSWVALLTGKHPHTTGAFLNLLPPDQVKLGQTLPARLRQHGYHTAYAIDEVRFSNVDESYGFDQAITPPIGSADFIVGTMSDTPLLNLVSATRIGKWFFPYSYANRATAPVYEPETFVERISDDVHFQSPMFLAAHMTLPHWPYGWRDAGSKVKAADPTRPVYYQNAVRRADRQFGKILAILERRGLLKNAIVIAFSDHGESFNPAAEPMVPIDDPLLAEIHATPAWGHGTSVLAPHQFRIFLAVRAYGPARQKLAQATGATELAASIEDIAPTLLDVLNVESGEALDGVSLEPTLRGLTPANDEWFAHRIRFTETEFNPRNLFDMTGDMMSLNAKTLADITNYYRVDPETDRIEMKRKYLDLLRRNRQFAAVGWSRMLGAFPSPMTDVYSFLLMDLKGGVPRKVESAAQLAGDPETAALWQKMCARYGGIVDSGAQSLKCGGNAATATATAAR